MCLNKHPCIQQAIWDTCQDMVTRSGNSEISVGIKVLMNTAITATSHVM